MNFPSNDGAERDRERERHKGEGENKRDEKHQDNHMFRARNHEQFEFIWDLLVLLGSH